MSNKKETLSLIENIQIALLGVMFFLFPLIFTSKFTDAFALPKQGLVILVVSVMLILIAVRMVIMSKVQIKSTPFDLPIFLFTLITFASAIFAVNRYDALTNFVPFLFSVLLFFVMVNTIKKRTAAVGVSLALVLGASISAIISILSYFQLYIIPSAGVQFQSFTTMGTLLDQAMYFAFILPLAGYIAWPVLSKKLNRQVGSQAEPIKVDHKYQEAFGIVFGICFVVLLAGFGVSLFMLVTSSKPVILPFDAGFQTALASISQDQGRVLKSFLLGSGFGTYVTDFTRFKPASFNLSETMWSFTFFRSSSYVLEILTTTGILGLISYLFIIYRFIRERYLFIPVILVFVASFIIPFSFTMVVLMFAMLGLFASLRALSNPRAYPDLEFYFVALKKGFLVAVPEGQNYQTNPAHRGYSRSLPLLMAVVVLLFVGMIGFMVGRYILSDLALQRSLVAFSQNNAQKTYDEQVLAINLFPYRDTNHRVFSQLNLTLANSLASAQPQGQDIPQETQQQILTLIQQSINSGRNAVTVSPQTALNWNSLSSIYRSLINFGENADQFAITTNQQAIALDPTNPQQYINLGGIYYQLGRFTDAQNQFQLAVQFKPDYANAYYNLGHALEEQKKLEEAVAQYIIVRNLVANDKASLDKINAEIAALEGKVQNAPQASNVPPSGNQEPIDVNQPANQLPERDPRAEIPGPSGSPSPSPSPAEQ